MLFADGGAYCNRCGYTSSQYVDHTEEETVRTMVVNPSIASTTSVLEEYNQCPILELKDRGISLAAAERYKVRSTLDQSNRSVVDSHLYPMYKQGKHTGYKKRVILTKTFNCIGDCKDTDLFGMNVVPPNGKRIYITEGECDALALYQVLKESSTIHDWEPSVVSLSTGSSSAANQINRNFDYLDSFEQIIFVLDQDEPGKKATDEACMVLPHKSYVAKLSLKDPNEMLVQGKGNEMYWACMKHYTKYQPDNIINGADTWELYKNNKNKKCIPYPWPDLNSKTYGARLGEVVTITSGSGSGKTQFMREIKHHFHNTTDYKFADIALEEGVGDTVSGLMSVQMNKRLHLPDTVVSELEEKAAHAYLFDTKRWDYYDHFGGMDDSNLFNKIRWFANNDHKVIFLDHLSIIVSEFAADGNERQRIDTIMTKLAKMAKELNILIFLIVHLRKTSTSSGKSFEEGVVPSLDDLRGSGSLKQLSWDVLAISRNQQHTDHYSANTSLVTVLKCRFTGRTGEADYLHFVGSTGRMIKTEKPANYEQA